MRLPSQASRPFVVAALSAALLVGCAREADPSFPVGPYALPPSPDEAARIENIVCSIPIDKKRMSLAQAMQKFRVPGVSAAAMVDGRVVWARGFGYADPARGVPMTPETVLQAASISKAVTAVGVLRMVEHGLLSLDEDVSDYLDDWEATMNGRHVRITLRQLLSHSSGLGVHGFPGYPMAKADDLPETYDVLNGRGNSPVVRLQAPPGARTDYSGGGFTVVQAAVEEQVQSPFSAAMYEWLIQPFGLRRSSFEQPLPEEKARFAARAPGVPGGWHVYPEGAAAGMWTTPTDLLTLGGALYRSFNGGPSPLSRGMTFMMLSPTSVDKSFGLGWIVHQRGQVMEAYHNGGNAGFTAVLIWRTDGKGAAVMVNGDGPIAEGLARAIGEEYGWRGGKDHGCGAR